MQNRSPSFAVLLLLTFAISTKLGAQSFIQNMDPPFWWVGMPVDTVQIMVYGNRVAQLAPVVDYPGVNLARVVHGDGPNYVFLYLHINPETEPGTLAIQWRDAMNLNGRTVGRTPFELKTREERAIQGYTPADAIYLITPDRFANGNLTNDEIAGMSEGVNRADDSGRHGGDIAGILQHLDYIDDLGFTAIWLNPILENDQPRWSYHGYATTDYYRVDSRFGSNEGYKVLVDAARQRGIKVIMDMVMNHCGSEHWWMEELPTEDWINNGGVYAQTTHRRTTLRDPYAAKVDLSGFSDGWFVEEMPDLNQRQPLLSDYLIQNTLWWIEYLGLSGIRMDTYPYADADFMSDWSCAVMNAYPDFNICGEEWSLNPAVLAYWQRDEVNPDGYTSCLPGLLDFPLNHAFMQCLTEKESWHSDWIPLYEMLGNDFLYAHPCDHVIFPDNHDMSRVHTQFGDDVRKTRLAAYFYATTRGIPQFFYGTEILMSNAGGLNHGKIRSDFPGGWTEDSDDVNGFIGVGLSEEALAFQAELRMLLNWRRKATAVHMGTLKHYVPVGGSYVYFREFAEQILMIILNQSDESEILELGRFDEVLRGRRGLIDAITGQKVSHEDTIEVPGWKAWVLEVQD